MELWEQLESSLLNDINHLEVVNLILNVLPKATNLSEVEVLDKAITNFNFDINKYRSDLLQKCIQWHHTAVLEYLIDNGIDFQTPIYGISPLTLVCRLSLQTYSVDIGFKNINEEIFNSIKLLLQRGADPNCDGSDAFFYVMSDKNINLVKLFIDAGVNFTMNRDEPLAEAIREKHFLVAKLLIESGADVANFNSKMATITPVNYLVDAGIDPMALAKIWCD